MGENPSVALSKAVHVHLPLILRISAKKPQSDADFCRKKFVAVEDSRNLRLDFWDIIFESNDIKHEKILAFPFHVFYKFVEKFNTVVGTGRGFWVILNACNR